MIDDYQAKLKLAHRLVWWQTPAQAVCDEPRLLAQVMVMGTLDDMLIARKLWSRAAFLEVLADPPPGLFDAKSWNYWHVIFHLPVSPLPVHHLGFDWRMTKS